MSSEQVETHEEAVTAETELPAYDPGAEDAEEDGEGNGGGNNEDDAG